MVALSNHAATVVYARRSQLSTAANVYQALTVRSANLTLMNARICRARPAPLASTLAQLQMLYQLACMYASATLVLVGTTVNPRSTSVILRRACSVLAPIELARTRATVQLVGQATSAIRTLTTVHSTHV